MRHRRKFVLLGGVTEQPDEKIADVVTSILNSKLALSDLKASSLTVCHRMGMASDKRPRPVLIRFADPEVKAVVWKTKTKLKGSPYVLSEFLTKQRQSTFSVARKLFGVPNVWTLDGNINIKLPDGKRRRVFGYEEVLQLGEKHGKTLEPAVSLASNPGPAKTCSPEPTATQMSTRSRRNIVAKNK